jgi:hypothetical protein
MLTACFAVILENEEDAEQGYKKEPHLKVVLRRKTRSCCTKIIKR